MQTRFDPAGTQETEDPPAYGVYKGGGGHVQSQLSVGTAAGAGPEYEKTTWLMPPCRDSERRPGTVGKSQALRLTAPIMVGHVGAHTVLAQLVPEPCGLPPWAKQLLGLVSMHVPPERQQASGGCGQNVVEQDVPGPCGEPPSAKQTLGSRSLHEPLG